MTTIKKYVSNESGNFGVMFALFSTVLIFGVGVAVDVSGMLSQRGKLQNYIDAAVLSAVTSGEKDKAELQAIVDSHIAQLNLDGWDVEAHVSFDGNDLVIDSKTTYKASLIQAGLKLLGSDKGDMFSVKASTAAPLSSQGSVNIALVLDTTQSMAGSNIAGLKTAARDLLNNLEALGDGVKVSIIPFGQYVNIESQRGQHWLDLNDEGYVENQEITTQRQTVIEPGVCTPTGNIIPGRDIYNDGVLVGRTPDVEEETCTEGVLSEPEEITTRYDILNRWNGCAGSRENGNNVRAAFDGIQIPAALESYRDNGDRQRPIRPARCGSEMIPLGTDYLAMKDLIEGLETTGETYLPSGLIWGWRALTPEAPFTEASQSSEDTQNVMIFMTDGFNTLSQVGIYHNGRQSDDAIQVAHDICENIKNDEIQVYTVAYNIPDVADAEATQNLLRHCASTPSNSFEAKNAGQLKSVFNNIIGGLGSIRLKFRPAS